MNITRLNYVLKRPVITEKATLIKDRPKRNGEPLNQYVFEVARDANKIEVKQAIEQKYSVKVASVRTVNVKGKIRTRFTKSGRTEGRTSDWKKAVVTLVKDNKIEFVEGA
jgi:large subunit ribosomal protein L23